jgi:hypothetical protein
MEVLELSKKQKNTMDPAQRDVLYKEMRRKDEKLVKGRFEFVDAQGGFFEWSFRKYKGELFQKIRFDHGEVCEIPMVWVKHLNNTYRKVRRYNLELPSTGGKTPRAFDMQSRIRFTPIDFL